MWRKDRSSQVSQAALGWWLQTTTRSPHLSLLSQMAELKMGEKAKETGTGTLFELPFLFLSRFLMPCPCSEVQEQFLFSLCLLFYTLIIIIILAARNWP